MRLPHAGLISDSALFTSPLTLAETEQQLPARVLGVTEIVDALKRGEYACKCQERDGKVEQEGVYSDVKVCVEQVQGGEETDTRGSLVGGRGGAAPWIASNGAARTATSPGLRLLSILCMTHGSMRVCLRAQGKVSKCCLAASPHLKALVLVGDLHQADVRRGQEAGSEVETGAGASAGLSHARMRRRSKDTQQPCSCHGARPLPTLIPGAQGAR
jgi:hypothetical protein